MCSFRLNSGTCWLRIFIHGASMNQFFLSIKVTVETIFFIITNLSRDRSAFHEENSYRNGALSSLLWEIYLLCFWSGSSFSLRIVWSTLISQVKCNCSSPGLSIKQQRTIILIPKNLYLIVNIMAVFHQWDASHFTIHCVMRCTRQPPSVQEQNGAVLTEYRKTEGE